MFKSESSTPFFVLQVYFLEVFIRKKINVIKNQIIQEKVSKANYGIIKTNHDGFAQMFYKSASARS